MNKLHIGVIAVLIIVAITLLVILPPGFSVMASVPAGYTGILTTFGKVENTYLPSGLHYKKPWQRIVVMDNRIQTLRVAAGSVKDPTTTDSAETKDQQLLPTFEFEIQYQLNPEMSYEVFRNYSAKYEKTLLTSNVLQFIKETFAQYNADSIVGAKETIPKIIREKLAAATEPLGINIIRVNMVTYDFSPEYTQILEQRALLNAQLQNNRLEQQNKTIAAQTEYDVAVKEAEKRAETQRIEAENQNAIAIKEAEKEAETRRIAASNENEMALAKAKAKAESDKIDADNTAYVIRTKAEADKDARIAQAEATKAELEAKAAGLNDYIIQQDFIEKWDGKLVPNFGNAESGIAFTDYTDIISEYIFDTKNADKDK